MKKLNNITFNDLLCCGFEATYKNFKIKYCNSNVNIFYNDKLISGFICTSRKVYELKNCIKNEIKKHSINDLLKMSVDTLKTFLNDNEIEKLTSYAILKNSTVYNKTDKLYLMNEIKEYFIYR